jgi:hypothetical protein
LWSLELYPWYHRLNHRLKVNNYSVLNTCMSSYVVKQFSRCKHVWFQCSTSSVYRLNDGWMTGHQYFLLSLADYKWNISVSSGPFNQSTIM